MKEGEGKMKEGRERGGESKRGTQIRVGCDFQQKRREEEEEMAEGVAKF